MEHPLTSCALVNLAVRQGYSGVTRQGYSGSLFDHLRSNKFVNLIQLFYFSYLKSVLSFFVNFSLEYSKLVSKNSFKMF